MFGYGYGATYQPYLSYIARNVTPEGVVHHIHIGPVQVFFRYGLVGLSLYGLLWVVTLRDLLGIKRRWASDLDGRTTVHLMFALGLLGYLVNSLVFNVIANIS